MNTQEFLSQLQESPFSENTKAEVRTLIGNALELSPQLKESIKECLQREIEEDLKDVSIDPQESAQLEKELTDSLEAIEREASEDEAKVEQEVQELSDSSQKIDVLSRLHT